jgi:hypothetical protein
MKRKDIKKQPGYNWTEIANEVHIFVGCDASHPAMKQDHIWVEKNSFHMQIAAETYMAELGQLMWLILPISSIVPCRFGHPLYQNLQEYIGMSSRMGLIKFLGIRLSHSASGVTFF